MLKAVDRTGGYDAAHLTPAEEHYEQPCREQQPRDAERIG